MNDLAIQAQIHSLKQLNLDPNLGAERKARELQSYGDHLHKELARIDASDLMTPKAKQIEKEKIGGKIMQELVRYMNPFKAGIEKLQERALNGNSGNGKSDLERILSYLKQSEIRASLGLAKMDPVEIESHLDDPQFIDAVLSAPLPLLPTDRLETLTRERALKADPGLGAQIEQLTNANAIITAIARGIQAHIEASGYQGNDELIKTAQGAQN